MSTWKTEVNWLLPGATLVQVRDLADPRSSRGVAAGRLVATVTDDDHLRAQVVHRRRNQFGPVLRARLLPDDRGVLIQGHLSRPDLVNRSIWVGFLAVIAGVVLSQGRGVGLVGGLVFVLGFAAVSPSLWKDTARSQREHTEKLQAALLTRFAVDGEPEGSGDSDSDGLDASS